MFVPRTLWPLAMLVAIATGVSLAAQQAQESRIFRSSAETVSVFATVIGRDGRLVTGLERNAFSLRDNGRQQPFAIFDAAARPIHLIVLLDASGSMTGNQSVLRGAAVQLFTRLLPDDRARVGHFGEKISLSPAFTNDVDELIRGLWIDVERGGPTPLWKAISAAMIELAPIDARRVVLVLTDGKDNGSKVVAGYKMGPSIDDVIAQAHREDVMVYAIGMHSMDLPADQVALSKPGTTLKIDRERAGPDPGLRRLAAETGGGYFELAGTENLSDVFATVADELHQQYLIGFRVPDADGKVHRLEISVSDPNLTVRARRSYLAPGR